MRRYFLLPKYVGANFLRGHCDAAVITSDSQSSEQGSNPRAAISFTPRCPVQSALFNEELAVYRGGYM